MQGIKIIKFFAWERNFQQRIDHARDAELRDLSCFVYTRSIIIITWVRARDTPLRKRHDGDEKALNMHNTILTRTTTTINGQRTPRPRSSRSAPSSSTPWRWASP